MSVMMLETCWVNLMRINIYTCDIYLVLSYPTIMMHGHMNIKKYVEIKRQLDATDDIYCRFYCMLNMFRTILCPSSGAREYYTDGRCLWYLVLHLVGVLFPHINDDARSKSLHIISYRILWKARTSSSKAAGVFCPTLFKTGTVRYIFLKPRK